MSDNVRLTPKQRQAIACLLTEPTMLAAAEKAGITDRTIRRWLDEPDFREALRDAESQAVDTAARRLVGLSVLAGDVIEEILISKKVPNGTGTRLRAATAVFDWIIKLRTYNDLEAEILDMSRKLDEIRNLKTTTNETQD